MTNPITPEAVERLCRNLNGAEHALHDADLDGKASDVAEAATTLRALARELAEVKAERDRLHGDIDWLRFQREVMHRRAQKAEGLLSRAMQFADGIILIAKQNGTYPRYALAMKRFARARTGEAFSLGYYLWSKEIEAAKADLATARTQIVAAQEAPTERQLKDACMSYDHSYGIMGADQRADLEWSAKEWWRCIVRALPLTDPADALAEHDREENGD